MPGPANHTKSRSIAVLGMLLAATIWGSTFIVQIIAARAGVESMQFIALRFLVATFAILGCSPFLGYSRRVLLIPSRGGISLGVVLWLAAYLQQVGMETTTAAKGGFITGLSVAWVPFLMRFVYGRPIPASIWLSTIFSIFGLWFLCGIQGEHFIRGDLWILACALVYSFHFIFTEDFVARERPLTLAFQQCATTAALGLFVVLLNGSNLNLNLSKEAVGSILYAGLLSSGVAYTIQIFAQSKVPAMVAAIVLGLESVFAAIFGWILLNQQLSTLQILGATLMFIGATIAVTTLSRQ